MKRPDDVYLLDILDAIAEIETFVEGTDRAAFEASPMMRRAVLYDIAVIGEAANRLSKEFLARHAHIPWRNIIDMRNIVIHQYGGVNLDVVWTTVTEGLATLQDIYGAWPGATREVYW